MSRGVVNVGTLEVGLPAECPIGQHTPAIVHRSGGHSALVVNVCGKCGREIQRQTEAGGPDDPWLTEEQHAAEMRELAADDRGDDYERPEDRCPPRE